MRKAIASALFIGALATAASLFAPKPVPPSPVKPEPPKIEEPKIEEPKPKKPKRWGPNCPAAVGREVATVRDGSSHDGVHVQADLPVDQLVRNAAGTNGMGLCVFTAIMFAARLQNVPQLADFQEWMKNYPGGGWPEKVDAAIAAKCGQQRLAVPDYLIVENGDWELVRLALKTGRTPAISYTAVFPGDHMVNVVCMADGWMAFRDNNFIGENEIEWLPEEEGKRRCGGGNFWAVILLAPRPPPVSRPILEKDVPAYGEYEWRRFPDCLQWSLWVGGEQIGAYDGERDVYGTFRNGAWGGLCNRPPVPLPDEAYGLIRRIFRDGIRYDYTGSPRYTRKGVEIARDEAFDAVSATGDKPALTVIGTVDQLKTFRDAYTRTDLPGRFAFQGYTPDNWAVRGFVHDGSPTIYVQSPDGKIILHLKSFDDQTMQVLGGKSEAFDPSPLLFLSAGLIFAALLLSLWEKT